MGNRKRVKSVTGSQAVVKLNGKTIPMYTGKGQGKAAWSITSGSNVVFSSPVAITTASVLTFSFDPFGHWSDHEIKKKHIGPTINFLRFLAMMEIIDDNELYNWQPRVIPFTKAYRKKGDPSPRNPYLKHLKECEKKKGRSRRT